MASFIEQLEKNIEKKLEARMTPIVKALKDVLEELQRVNVNLKEISKKLERAIPKRGEGKEGPTETGL